MSDEVFFNVDEAATFLRVKKCTIYRWVHERRISYRKHGSRLVFTMKSLMDWSEKQKVNAISDLTLFLENNTETPKTCSLKTELGRIEKLAS